jgi:DNA-binding MarR family transcriptional regulator
MKLMPEGSYSFPIYSGILEHRHYKKIGSAIWLFLWCISSTTSEKEKDGTVWGVVLGNKPIKISELIEEFGVSDRTIRSWIKTLEDNHYIRVTRAPYGLIFTVRNSKKFKNRSVVSFQSEQGERQDSTDQNSRERQVIADHSEENCRSNKDITEILIDRWIKGLPEDEQKELSSRSGVLSSAVGSVSTGQIVLDKPTIEQRVHLIERYYMQQNGLLNPVSVDWEHVREVANEAIPLDLINFFIDLAIARKKATRKRPSDKIRLFSYCKTVIFNCWDDLSAYLEDTHKQKSAIKHRPVSKMTKQEKEIAELEKFIEEEKKRGSG